MNGRVSKLIRKYCSALSARPDQKNAVRRQVIGRWLGTPHNKRRQLRQTWGALIAAAERGRRRAVQ